MMCPRTLPLAAIAHLEEHLGDSKYIQVLTAGGLKGAAMVCFVGAAITAAIVVAGGEPLLLTMTASTSLCGVVLLTMASARRKADARGRQVRASGIPAIARIDAMVSTGRMVDSHGIYTATATVHQDGLPARVVQLEICRAELRTGNRSNNQWIKPGSWVRVRIDPNDPNFLVPDAGAR